MCICRILPTLAVCFCIFIAGPIKPVRIWLVLFATFATHLMCVSGGGDHGDNDYDDDDDHGDEVMTRTICLT